jgi:hypothetical protein
MCGDWRLAIGDWRLAIGDWRLQMCCRSPFRVARRTEGRAFPFGMPRLGRHVGRPLRSFSSSPWSGRHAGRPLHSMGVCDTPLHPGSASPRLPGRADTPVGPYIPWAYAIRPYILARLLLVSLIGSTRRSAPTFHGRMRYAPTCPWAYAIRPYILARLLPVSLVGSTRRSAPTCPWAYAIRPYTPTPLLPFTYFGSVPQMSVPLR